MDDLRELISAAFARARLAGKEDWSRMTLPVLKNRLLDLTGRKFSERDYGALSFRDLLRDQASNLVRVDDSTQPPMAELVVGVAEPVLQSGLNQSNFPSARIRGDLWRAVLDYSSGRLFTWEDGSVLGHEPDAVLEPDQRRLPTVTPEELGEWRQEFFDGRRGSLDPVLVDRLDAWNRHRMPSTFLPPALKGAWHNELKRRIENRLRAWFDEQGLPPPANLVVDSRATPLPAEPRQDVERLRTLVLECVAVMTETELRALQFSPEIVLRARSKGAR